MKTKQKVLVITIIAVMALAIIGLTIGLVLVAQQATLNNSMTVSYTANNVDATITATGINYSTATATTGTTIELSDGTTKDLTTKTFTFDAAQAEATGGVEFEKAELTATGRAVYTFQITNTANTANKRELKVKATVFDANLDTTPTFANDGNVTVKIGTTEELASTMTENITTSTANVGIGGSSTTLVVVMSIDNKTLDVNQYKLSIKLDFSYDIAQDDWNGEVGTLPDATIVDGKNVIIIKTAEELAALAQYVNTKEATTTASQFLEANRTTVKLDSDIDLKNIEWTPIGYGTFSAPSTTWVETGKVMAFSFDGQGHTIRNLKISNTTETTLTQYGTGSTKFGGSTDNASGGVGLFGCVCNSTIQNLNVAKANVAGNYATGVIVGYMNRPNSPDRAGSITNCHVVDAVVDCKYANDEETGDKCGAIVGYYFQAVLDNCSATNSAITAGRDAGQLAGAVDGGSGDNKGATVTPTCIAKNVSVKPNNSYTGVRINELIVGRVVHPAYIYTDLNQTINYPYDASKQV